MVGGPFGEAAGRPAGEPLDGRQRSQLLDGDLRVLRPGREALVAEQERAVGGGPPALLLEPPQGLGAAHLLEPDVGADGGGDGGDLLAQ